MSLPPGITQPRRWLIEPTDVHFKDSLAAHGGNLALLVEKKGELVKRGGHRLVWRIRLDQLDVHVKRNQISGIRGKARRILRGHKAFLEARRLLELARADVPTLDLMGVAVEPGFFGASWIITRTASETQPLDKFLTDRSRHLQGLEKKGLAQDLAGLLATMHKRGFHHTDLHPGNILYSKGRNPAMLLVDVHDLKQISPSWPANLSNLVILNRWFHSRATRHDRWRFLRAYLDQFRGAGLTCPWSARTMARLIESKTRHSRHRLWRSRDYRCFQVNKDFMKVEINCSGAPGKGFAVNRPELLHPDTVFPAPFLTSGQTTIKNNTASPRSASSPTILKKSKSSTVFQWKPDGTEEKAYGWIVKDIPARSFFHRATGHHPCKRSWMLGHALRGRFLPTPMPLAWIRFPDGSERLIQSAVPNATLLDAWWKSIQTPNRRRALADKLGSVIHRMHAMGVRHRDLKAANLLVDAQDGPWLIDLVGVRLKRQIKPADQEADLARLARSALAVGGVSPSEMLRFLKSYQGGRLHPEWKFMCRKILRLATQKIRRNQRLGRANG